MNGRKLWFVGIGGSGLSAYAQLARAWGAEVGGWDRVRTPYLEPLADVRVEISDEPVVPDGWEAVVSSAYPSVPGLRRSEFLRELVAARPAIAVSGSHGKGTTAALIAYALRETGRDPAWLIGAPVPQLGSNAGFGDGHLVVEADESDRTAFALQPAIAVVTNIELDHHSEYASEAELRDAFEQWLASVPQVVRDAPPYDGELALPGDYNRRNAGAALAALELVGVSRSEAAPALARFTGTGRRFEVHESRRRTVIDDYGHHPSEVAAVIQGARERFPGAAVRVLFQPHLYSRTRHLAAEFADALAAADDVTVTDIYPAREQPVPGVTGKLIVDALSDRGVLAGWTPTVEQGAARLDRRGRAGDVLIVLGAGDVDRAVGMLGA
ncbi:MAG TPA: cyanophycin synthetase [Gaiellaceae bacterium]|nr:cyanophycin synthetase [Gaiellaceae bacterium]